MEIAYVTAMASLVTAVAAIVAPVVAAYISSRNNYKNKTTELFFDARVVAYRDFFKLISKFPHSPSADDLKQLTEYASYALLFSSSETQERISRYSSRVALGVKTPEDGVEVGRLRHQMLISMQKDLTKK